MGVDCSIFIPEVFEDLDRTAEKKLYDWVFEKGEIFVGAVICIHRDKDDLKFKEGSLLFTQDVVYTYAFSDLGSSEASCIRWGLFWVGWWNE